MSGNAESAGTPLRVAVTGASGLVGSALVGLLSGEKHRVLRLVRRAARAADEAEWDPARGSLDPAPLEGIDAVVHLAGASVGSGRWTPTLRERILQSRVEGTRLLAGTLAALERRPRVLISASAIGYYGDRGDEWVDEESAPGAGFLARVCEQWERETEAARAAGVRVVRLRIGLVLSASGGALAAMRPLFRLGLGGRIGSGRQFLSWIGLGDLVRAIHHLLRADAVEGAVNAVTPEPATNAEFTRTLARLLGRPALLALPAPLLRLALGREMADETLLASARVAPRRLLAAGFQFQHPTLERALRVELRG